MKWQNKKDYPYSEYIYDYSILAFKKKFIIFGGNYIIRGSTTVTSKSVSDIIAIFDPVLNVWTELAKLKRARLGHGVIQTDNEFIVVGGEGEIWTSKKMPTESCKFNGQSLICTDRVPNLVEFQSFPELKLIS